ncbi:MAG: PEP-CTERM sorting domain-containing protein [Planctomycetales bacterium]|nr:PEP-CTERM sorting domain-containing protein [Planctomycetales bacterium]
MTRINLCVCAAIASSIVAGSAFGVTIESTPGTVGAATDFMAPGTATVGADGGALFWVEFDPLLVTVPDAGNPFVYTATLAWTQAVDVGGVVVNEIVRGPNGQEGNLAAFGITPTVTDLGLSSGASFPALPFDVISYHLEVSGLNPGDTTQFLKIGSGGQVGIVPEPASYYAVGIIAAAFLLRRRRAQTVE